MNRKLLSAAAALLAAICLAPGAHAAPPDLAEGWSSWEVPTPPGTPFWCCWDNANEKIGRRTACKLDGSPHGFGTRGDETTDAVRVYAHSTGGRVDRLQTLAAACPVHSQSPIRQLSDVSPEDSVRWLAARAKTDSLVEQALGSMAMHRGELAATELATFARRDSRAEARKWAVFWLALVRGPEGADVASSVMFDDASADVRKHAAFALSQSKAPRAAPDLIRLGNTDKDGGVRAQAWFWLAQTGDAGAESAITAALRKDAEEGVRDEAVFALSQLPGDRAATALIAAAEDRGLSREQRRRAVFWLSQSDSDAAQKYLESVLALNPPN